MKVFLLGKQHKEYNFRCQIQLDHLAVSTKVNRWFLQGLRGLIGAEIYQGREVLRSYPGVIIECEARDLPPLET